MYTCILLSIKLILNSMELICILFNPIPILTPITSQEKFRLRQPNFSLYNRESFFLDDAESGISVWPHMYRLTTIWYTKTQHWQAKLAICTPVCKGLDQPLTDLNMSTSSKSKPFVLLWPHYNVSYIVHPSLLCQQALGVISVGL